MERLLLHERIAAEFTERFVTAARSLRLGAELAYGNDMGSSSTPASCDASPPTSRTPARRAQVLAGGRARPDLGPYFYEPTVLTGVTAAMDVRDEETFGPVVSLYTVGSDDEATRLANDTDYGLNAAVYTRDIPRGRRIAAAIQAGTVNINDGYAAAWGSTAAPMGGMKASGLGRRHGIEASPSTPSRRRSPPSGCSPSRRSRAWARRPSRGCSRVPCGCSRPRAARE